MIIAVEDRLDKIKTELKQKGYQVVDMGSNQWVDAIVYYNDGKYLDGDDGSMQKNFSLSHGDITKEAFLINAYDKSIDEVEQMLQRRSYSPLFGDLQ